MTTRMPFGAAWRVAPSPVDSALRGLSQAANKGRLWLALGAVGVLIKGRTRRAALRGAASLAITSAVVNGVVKPLVRRQRPDIALTPAFRRLTRQPWTSSFPSGHAASAAAFTAGAGLEQRAAGAGLAPLAAAVGYSRVHVGVHHMSDVVIGAAIGAGVALATQWWWPARPPQPDWPVESTSAARLDRGRGLLVLVNDAAGDGRSSADQVGRLLPEARLADLAHEADLDAEMRRSPVPIVALGVAGGDGSVAAVAEYALRRHLPLAVFPGGTFNHFALDLGIESVADSVRAVEAGTAAIVDLGVVNGTVFVNTVSLGPYPEIVRRRDSMSGRFGKAIATALATARVLRRQRPIGIFLDGEPLVVWYVFVANGRYRSVGSVPTWRERLDDKVLDVRYLRAGPLSRTRAVLSALTGISAFGGGCILARRSLRVASRDGRLEIARDGEPGITAEHLDLESVPGGLQVYLPARPRVMDLSVSLG